MLSADIAVIARHGPGSKGKTYHGGTETRRTAKVAEIGKEQKRTAEARRKAEIGKAILTAD